VGGARVTTQFRPGAVDYEGQAGQYSTARALSPNAEVTWREAITRHLGPLEPSLVLDLGSGTGRFSPLLASGLGVRVVGVEPSDGMREKATQTSAHPDVTYIAGDAEHIPLDDGSCDAAWLAYMIHHLPDRDACARELARVLVPGALALVAGAYTEARRKISLFRYFPEGLAVVDGFPLEHEIVNDLAAGGLEHITTETLAIESAPSLAAAAKRIRQRADSVLQLISDAAFEAGIRRLHEAVDKETHPRPIVDNIDLLVFRRP
jgi:ubiquinone/menaquinone biosynthesis C-methylase UbiE